MSDLFSRRLTVASWASHPAIGTIGLLLSLAVLGWSVSSSFFLSDDFLNFSLASRMSFWQWVNSELFGHWLPARKTLDWGLNSRPLSWPATVAVLLLIVGVAALLTRLVVLRLTGSGAWANVALVIVPVSAAVPGTVQWWAGAAQVIPAMACAAAIVLAVVWIPAARGWARAGVLSGLAVSLGAGLLFDERTAVSVAVAPGLLTLIVSGRKLITAWATTYAVAAPVLVVWYVLQSHLTSSSSGGWADVGTAALFTAKAVAQNAIPSLFGWVTRPAVWGEDVLWLVGAAFAVLLIALIVRARKPASAAWTVLVWLAAVVLTAAPTAIVRAGEFGVSAALEPRYLVMANPFGTIALVYVLSQQRPVRRATAMAITGIAAVLASVNLVYLHANPAGKYPREWAERFVASAQAQGVTHFYNTIVPGFVNPIAFYPSNLTAAILPQLLAGVDTVVTTPTAGLVGVDGDVSIVSPTPVGEATLTAVEGAEKQGPEATIGCFLGESTGGRLSFDAPAIPAGDGMLVVTVEGEFDDSGLRLVTGPSWDQLRDKTAGIGGSPPVPGSNLWVTTEEFDDMAVIGIDIQPGQSVCIDRVVVGTLPKTD